ncbi:MAG: exopolysaccharide biosynthesis polyprenyl glycosylphosphotransferase [Bacteroidales bacterium]|nr:exopolysaccharide biosynthesis polyprenyl glycosylphosphotransferase [Bacteroidales bacterium]
MPGIQTLSRLFRRYYLHGKSGNIKKLLVIADEEHLDMLDELMLKNKWGVQVVYIITDSPVVKMMFPQHSRIYPLKVNIKSLLRYDIVDEIVCCASSLSDEFLHELVKISRQYGVSLLLQPDQKHANIPVSGLIDVADYYFYVMETNPGRRASFVFKSMIEMIFALAALLLLLPLLAWIALIIKITSQGPAFFKQQRVGLRGRKFYIYKFRTMVADAEKQQSALTIYNESDGPAFKIANDPRITRFGRILRKTGIDEIPQLFNVMKGEMSLIGPRPMLPDEVSAQEEWQLKRLCIKPGITCTWQIQPQRNKVPFVRWMQLDCQYIENWSFRTDVRIFCRTIKTVLLARGL